jgi:phosphopantothenoylcysteine decarboxylase
MNILLGVTGSVAAIRAPALVQKLSAGGHGVKLVATRAAMYFLEPLLTTPRDREAVILDEDEWPGQEDGQRWRRDDPVSHIELRRWADALIVAPLDANTLAKFANGLADNCLTCVWRAWDLARPVVLAPAMNTLMWEHPVTRRNLREVASFFGHVLSADVPIDELIHALNARESRLRIVSPQSKRLACGDVGVGGMAELDEIIRHLEAVAASRG